MSIIDFRLLDAVIVTHLHHDHYADLFVLRYAIEGARRDGSRSGPLKLFVPGEPAGEYNILAGYDQAFTTIPIGNLSREPLEKDIEVCSLDIEGSELSLRAHQTSYAGYSVAVGGPGKLGFFQRYRAHENHCCAGPERRPFPV